MEQEKPIITTELEILNGVMGFGKKVDASLYSDRIDFWDGKTLKYQIKLSDVSKFSHFFGGGGMRFKMNDGANISLIFVVMPWRLLGLLGYFLSGGMKNSKAWKAELAKLGIDGKDTLF